MKTAVLVGLPRGVNNAVKEVLSKSHHIQEVPGFGPRHYDAIVRANVIAVSIDAMSNKDLEEIYAGRKPSSIVVAICGDKSGRKVSSKARMHCFTASAAPEKIQALVNSNHQ